MKLKYCFILLLLVCFLCGNVYAEDLNENLTSDSAISDDNQVILDENLKSEDISDDVKTGTDEVLGDVENENDDEENIIYFDAKATEDGNGSKEKPYNYLSDDRIPQEGGTIYLASGVYEFKLLSEMASEYGYTQFAQLNIVGENRENTVLYSGGIISFLGDNIISDITLIGFMFNVLDYPDFGIVSSLSMDNVIVNSLNLIDGSYYISNSKLIDGVAQPVMGDDTFGGAINALSPINLDLRNCSFINNSADFGGAINMVGGCLIVDNCSFTGNTANNYAGAIAVESDTYLHITDSRFENNNALADAGGAIYIRDSNAILVNVNVTLSSASFGGAVTALNSTLNIQKSNFKKNKVAFYGGAVYAMYCEVTLDDNCFDNNTALFGGALFVDNSNGSVRSDFINNSALIGSAVYSFSNEVSFDSVFVDDELYVNNHLNLTIYDGGDYPIFRYNPSNLTVLPDSYNLADHGWVSAVKNQLTEGNCWAFTAIAVLESCILKASGTEFDFSEENMKNIMAYYSDYGWSYFMTNTGGGNMDLANGYFTSWFGPILDSEDPYTNKGVLSPLLKSIFHVQNVVFLKRDDYLDNDMIKKAILDYGAVGTSMYYSDTYLKNQTSAFYCSDDFGVGNHAITIVGWNDSYSRDNFLTSPEGDGAWIVKNSWGNDWGDNGYFYVSYYDKMFAPIGQSESAYTIILNDTIKYDKNYQYDTSKAFYSDRMYDKKFLGDEVTYYNIFAIEGDEYLAAVSTYFNKIYDYKLEISVNGELKATKESSTLPGYYTIPLDTFISLKKGDKLKVSFTIKTVDGTRALVPLYYSYVFTNNILTEGTSFIADVNETYDLFNDGECACIKAFTIVDKIKTQIALTVQDSQVTAIVTDQYGNIMNGDVVFNVNNKTQNIKIIDGKAIFDLNYYDMYNITVTWNKTGYEQSANTTFYETPWDAVLKIDDVNYLEDIIINITLDEDKLLKNNLTIKIGDYLYSVNQSDLIFTVPDTLDAKLWNVSISYVTENGYEKQVNKSFNINKKHVTIYPGSHSLGNQINSVVYNSNTGISVLTNDQISNSHGGAVAVFETFKFNDYTVTFNGTSNTIEKIDDKSFYLRNLNTGTYKLNITLNHPNFEGSYYGDIKITKATASLSIPELVITYGEGGQVTINSLASSVKLYKNPSEIVGLDDEKTDNDNYGKYISISGKNITVSPDLNQGSYDFTFIIDDVNYESSHSEFKYTLSHFKVTVKKASSNVTVSIKDSVYNDTVIVDYAIDNINNTAIVPDGSVTVAVYNEKGEIVYINTTATFRNETGSFNISNYKFNTGTYTVNVNYHGDYNFIGNNTNHTFTVGKAETSFDNINDIEVIYGNYTVTVSGSVNASDYNGSVTITIDGTTYTANANANGSFSADLKFAKDIHVGTHKVIVSGSDCLNYNAPKATDFNLIVKQAEAKFNEIENITVTYGDGVMFINGTISDADNADAYNGTVTVMIDDKYMNTTQVSNHIFSLNVSFDGELNAGNHTITVSGSQCLNYKQINNLTINLTVKKATVSITSVENITVTYGINNTVNVTGRINTTRNGIAYNGKIIVLVNNQSFEGESLDGAFTVKINGVDKWDADNYILIVKGEQTDNYNEISEFNNSYLNITKQTPVINASITKTVKVNQNANVTVTLPITATGIVYVEFNGTNHTINLDSHETTTSLPIAPAGTYEVIVHYNGDKNYHAAKPVEMNFTVNKVNSSLNVSNVVFDYGGFNITTVEYTGASNVTAHVVGHSEADVNVGDKVISVSGLGAGNYVLNVTTVPDRNHYSVSVVVNITVFKAKSSIMIDKISDVNYGESVKVVFNAVNATTLTYEVKKDGNIVVPNSTVDNANTNITLPVLSVGNYIITIANAENANYSGFVATSNFTVSKIGSKVEVAALNVTYPDNVNVSVKVENATEVTYMVKYVNGTVVISNSTWTDLNKTIELNLGAGDYIITVVNKGNDNIEGSVSSVNFIVNKAHSTLTADNIVFNYGGFNTTAVDYTGASNVTAYVVGHSEAIVNIGDKVISVSGLSVGTYVLNVTTVPDDNHITVTRNVTVTVNKVDSSLNVSDVVFDYGGFNTTAVDYTGAFNITAYVVGHSEANIIIADNVIEVSGLSVGSYVLSVTTVPDENHNAVTKNVTITVNKANEKADIKIPELTPGKSNMVPVTIGADAKGNVTLTIDNEIISVTDLVNGSAVIEVPKLSSGNHIISLTYSGDENHTNFTQTQTLNIASLAKITSINVKSFYDDGSVYKVRVFDDDGVPLSGAKVTFKVNRKTVAVKTTDKNGYATYKIIQTPKSYSLSAEINGLKTTNKLKVKQVIKVKKITKVKKSRTTKIKITLKGKNPYKKKKLTIKFKGKNYKIKTNNKGVAKFKVTQKMLNKFKKNKKVKYTIIFKSDKLTRYLKIR